MRTDTRIRASASRRFAASAERVFDAWLDPAQVRRWMGAALQDGGLPGEVLRVAIEPRVGGRFTFSDRRGEEVAVHWGTYREIDRPRTLVFSWFTSDEDEREDASTVTLTIEPDGDGCTATIVHEMDARWAEYRERTAAGWARMLEAAGRVASVDDAPAGKRERGGHGVVTGPDTIRFERMLPGPIERVWAYLTESEKRRRWLARGEMELRPGGRVELHFLHRELSPHVETVPQKYRPMEHGCVVTGRVTRCEPPHVLAYTWGESDGFDTEVSFELAESDGEVLLTLTHRRLADRELMISVAAGWHTHLDILVDRLADHVPAPFWSTHTALENGYAARLPASPEA